MTPDLFASITPERKKYLATMVYISQTIRNAGKVDTITFLLKLSSPFTQS